MLNWYDPEEDVDERLRDEALEQLRATRIMARAEDDEHAGTPRREHLKSGARSTPRH